jgi:GH15 family glucan-1,4-alpha-glucosidase
MALRIEDYAMIGALGSAGLVGRDGSIDWFCWPRFDSDACFAALLGKPEHGRWLIGPQAPTIRVTRRYRPNTLILETRFETDQGAATLIDFMPPRRPYSRLIRIVKGEKGKVAFHSELILRFATGAIVPWVTRIDDVTLRAIAGPDMAVLHTPARMRGENFKTIGDFTVTPGEEVPFVLSFTRSHQDLPEPVDVFERLSTTENLWTAWAGRNKIEGPWNEAVTRSLIVLKALTYWPTGGMARSADNLAARIHRWLTQLGLPLLLAARCDANAAVVDECR